MVAKKGKKNIISKKSTVRKKSVRIEPTVLSTKTVRVCSKCRDINGGVTEFCTKCGGKLVEENLPVCPKCGSVNSKNADKCFYCGEILRMGRVRKTAVKEPKSKKDGITYYVDSPKDLPPSRDEGIPAIEASEIMKQTFNAYKKNMPVLILWSLINVIGIIFMSIFSSGKNDILSSAIFIAGYIFVTAISTVLIYVTFSTIDKTGRAGIGQAGGIISTAAGRFFEYIWVIILYGLICIGGFLLLIIPGIIFSYKYYFMGITAVLNNDSEGNYMQSSALMTAGHKMEIFVCAFLSSLATIPVHLVCLIAVYVFFVMTGREAGWNPVSGAASFLYIILATPFTTGITYFMYKKLNGR